MKPTLTDQIKAARRVSVPLIAITTPDPAATIETVCELVKSQIPKIQWDVVQGLRSLNVDLTPEAAEEVNAIGINPGKVAIAGMVGEYDGTVGNPVAFLTAALKAPKGSLLFMHLAGRFLQDPSVVQAMWNLRDLFKQDRRTLVLLGADVQLPPELQGDVVVFDEPLPGHDALQTIIQDCYDAAEIEKPSAEILAKGVEAVQGLSAFQTEQVVAMSLTPEGLDVDSLWERKRRQIELTPGLKVVRETTRFKDIGGVEVVKSFLGQIMNGEARPNAVIFIDEIEKFMAGSAGGAGDTSGVSQDQLGTLLGYMQDHSAAGCIFVGPPGAAKSAVAKAAGNEGGIPTIQLDLGGLKGSLVGQSEQQLRNALKVVTSVSNGRSLWIATCNAISDLPPELRRRFTLGTFFFELPDAAERREIWKLYIKKYRLEFFGGGLPGFDDEGWTGAEIKQCCDIAWRLGFTPRQASAFVVPVSKSAKEQLDRLRKGAEGRFLSASKPGVYSLPAQPVAQTKGRKFGDE